MTRPRTFTNEAELDEFLSCPVPAVVESMRRLSGDLMILGAGGKMGVSLARMAQRASNLAGVERRIVAVSRFSDERARTALAEAGLDTRSCDLLDWTQVQRLPRAGHVLYMVGRKFGTAGEEPLTWAANAVAPAFVAEHFQGSRITAFSTGCVYPFVTPASGGCAENEPPRPLGEYAQSCLGRERVFEHYSRTRELPLCLVRLNYAIDLRYGVLHDLACSILSGAPIDLSMGWFNCIWQGDANAFALRALEHASIPPTILNVTGAETHSIRTVAEALSQALQHPVRFTGTEQGTAYLSHAGEALRRFGPLTVSLGDMIRWTAQWVSSGGRSLGKPTHFEVRDGSF